LIIAHSFRDFNPLVILLFLDCRGGSTSWWEARGIAKYGQHGKKKERERKRPGSHNPLQDLFLSGLHLKHPTTFQVAFNT
jgi:hypothetical protein